jgi:hypothetical protein
LTLGFKSDEWSVEGVPDNLAIDEGVVPLFHGKADSNEFTELLAWSFARTDGGRSCATVLSFPENKNNSYFQRFLFNAVRWAFKRIWLTYPHHNQIQIPRF